MTRNTRSTTIAAAALVVAIAATMDAGGGLDPTFGTGGKAVSDFGGYDDSAHALVLQPDGKLVAAGSMTGGGMGLARYNPDGNLDTTFGESGRAYVPFTGIAAAYDLVLQPDGRLVTAGYAYNFTFDTYDLALARFEPNGTLDYDFGTGGTVTLHVSGSDFIGQALVLRPDGTFVVAGSVYNGSYFDFALVRYDAQGRRDMSFGNSGMATTDFGNTARPAALLLQDDGKLVAAGEAYVVPADDSDFVLVRYNADGSPDLGFGVGGRVVTDFSGRRDRGSAVVLQTDGKLVVAGGASDFQLARYTENGSLDASFGVGGTVTTDVGGDEDWANELVLQPDGMLVAAGMVWNGVSDELVLTRYTTAGLLDPSFGSGGQVTIDFFGFSFGQWKGLVQQPDGKLVAAGHTYNEATNFDFALVRYDPASSVDSPVLTVNKAGTGSGTVSSNPAGITCGGVCTAAFSDGAIVTLTPSANPGSTFSGWSGDCSSSGVVTMTSDKSCIATFDRVVHTLTVTKAGAGSGLVTSNPQGIDCGSTCVFSFAEDDRIALTSTPNPGSNFSGWGGDCDAQGTVTMIADKACTATFSVRAASSIALSSSKNPSTLGQTVTFTATVNGVTPTGSVTFTVDGAPLKTVTVQAVNRTTATASFAIGTLRAGTRQVTAVYDGDVNNFLATSNTVSQVISGNRATGRAARAILNGLANNAIIVDIDRMTGRFGADASITAYDVNHLAVGNSFAAGFSGPRVSASSLTGATLAGIGTGAARAVAYRTVLNTTNAVEEFTGNATADGVITVPNLGHVTVAVYIVETDAFLGALDGSGLSLEQFLVGQDPVSAIAAGTEAQLSLARRFPSGVRGSYFQKITASTPATDVDVRGLLEPGKGAVIIFDLTVYAPPGSAVNFSDTLKPAPVFLTDASGNPSPLTLDDSVPTDPPVPTALTLSPTSTAASLTTAVTVTAIATSGAGAPVPGATVTFAIAPGPNPQLFAPAVTDEEGKASFTYAGGSATGTDQIQARIGALPSNIAAVTWTAGPLDHISISPASATIAAGGSQPYAAQAFDQFNNSRGDVTAATTFTIAPNGSCTGATCTASTGGPHMVTATHDGKTATATLDVTGASGYAFQGFFEPIDMSTPGLAVWNTVKAGQGVPVKWLLLQDGVPVSDPLSFAGLFSYPIACPGAGSLEDAIELTATSNSALQYNGDGNWQINWKTPASEKGSCRAVTVKLSNGTTSPAAYFKLK